MDFERGHISYLITGVWRRPGKRDKRTLPRSLSVVSALDVAALPPAKPVSLTVRVGKRGRGAKVVILLDVPRRGYLKGDAIPVGLRINHLWSVQAPAAIVITLARMSRLNNRDETTQVFRKDLAQSVLPLYTDPATFCAVANTTLRVPPDVFPTTKHALATFEYLIEVAVDLSGKLDANKWANANPAVELIDTDRFKHRRSVVSAWAEVVIGTHRSAEDAPLSRYDSPATPATADASFATADLGDRGAAPSRASSWSADAARASLNGSAASHGRPPRSLASSVSPPPSQSSSGAGASSSGAPGAAGGPGGSFAGGFPAMAHPGPHGGSPEPERRFGPRTAAGPPPPPAASDDKSTLAAREALLYPSAPLYEADEIVLVSAPSEGAGLGYADTRLDDKRELERTRLAALATSPYDDVPVYERHAGAPASFAPLTPSAPAAPDASYDDIYDSPRAWPPPGPSALNGYAPGLNGVPETDLDTGPTGRSPAAAAAPDPAPARAPAHKSPGLLAHIRVPLAARER